MKKEITTDILVIGGGAAGLSAAAEASESGAKVIVIESDLHLGGQLVKQTHKFFGSKDEYAGTRGYKIAGILMSEIEQNSGNVEMMTNTVVTGYYIEDGIFTAMRGEESYFKIKPQKAIVATGAQERLIPFPNNDIPGVYGAGAVQTLMNVYGVTPGKRVLMIGAGNIGLIVSYQLLQAGVGVAAVVEAMPKIGGYWVHAAKIRRLGVPILLRHSIKEALGGRVVDGAVIMELDDKFNPTGRESKIDCDVICLAVGLTPTTELLSQAGCDMTFVPQLCGFVPLRDRTMRTSNPDFWSAGDATGIEEASAAMVEGRIAGLSAAQSLGFPVKTERFGEYWARLDHLRAGEVGEKIRAGIGRVLRDRWED
ncbi:MAG: NAD(P)/FAD-dependent oxidoreductase [Synergistaceae bacterium]|jgi:sarcosine oxidase subunit alpha|nr:NAD(P)/FAD-dependent oxidoreductase [Synergistaceae bacterium]